MLKFKNDANNYFNKVFLDNCLNPAKKLQEEV